MPLSGPGSTLTLRQAQPLTASASPPESCGLKDERQNRNGSLIRVLPLSLWHRGDDQSLMALAARQSLPTHWTGGAG